MSPGSAGSFYFGCGRFRILDLGFKTQGLGWRIEGVGFMVLRDRESRVRRDVAATMENPIEKSMEHKLETGVVQGIILFRRIKGFLSRGSDSEDFNAMGSVFAYLILEFLHDLGTVRTVHVRWTPTL